MILKSKVIKFNPHERSVFEKYQPSGLGPQRWHLLDYLVDAIWHVGGVK